MVISHSDNILLMWLSGKPGICKNWGGTAGVGMCGWLGWVFEDSLEVFWHAVGLFPRLQVCVCVSLSPVFSCRSPFCHSWVCGRLSGWGCWWFSGCSWCFPSPDDTAPGGATQTTTKVVRTCIAQISNVTIDSGKLSNAWSFIFSK